MVVCGECNALYSGPHCGHCLGDVPVAASGAPTHAAPAVHQPAATASSAVELTPWMEAVVLAAVLVPISSLLGIHAWETGIWWIWSISVAADAVFVIGTMGAHVAALWVATRVERVLRFAVAAIVAFALHWVVYAISWELVVAADDGVMTLDAGFAFVAQVGYFGLAFCSAAAALGVWRLGQRLG